MHNPTACPVAFPSLMERPDGTKYFQTLPCNNYECKACRERRHVEKLQKFKDGLTGTEYELTEFDRNSPAFEPAHNWLLRQLRKTGGHCKTIKHPDVLYVIHTPVGFNWKHPSTSQKLTRKQALRRASRLLRTEDTIAAWFSRKTFKKTLAEVRRQNDRRLPHEKHRRVCSSQYGPIRFQKLALDNIGRTLEHHDPVTKAEADTMWLKANPFPSKQAVKTHTARFVHSEREERRAERASWYDSGG